MHRIAIPIFRSIVLAAVMAASSVIPMAAADLFVPRELQLEAAFFRKFLGYVSWARGQREGAPLLCVLGETPLHAVLTELLRQDDEVQELRKVESAEEGRSCSLLYISETESGYLPELIESLSGSGVLTVSNIKEFADLGGMIQFIVDGEHVRFIINQAAAEKEGIQISSQLLALARRTVR